MAVLIIPARSSHTHGQAVGDEFVVLNHATKAVHHLEGAAAAVWAAAGSRIDATVDIRAAVDQLCLLDLLEAPAGVSRRSMLKRTGVIAAGAGIASVALPMADAAASLTAGAQAITLSPISGPKGTVVTVAGTGFFPGGTITSVTFGAITVTPSSTTIDGSGNASFTFVVPAGAPLGSNTVSVTDNHNNTATKPFNVTAPTLIATPSTLPRNGGDVAKSVTLTGSGFAPNSTLTATRGGDFTAGSGGPYASSATGTVPAGSTFTGILYPNGSGSGTITLTDSFGNTATVTILH